MESDNRRIAKNTIFLYFRTALMILVNLYSSRVILQALGVSDFGLYGAIGSIVAMFTIINGSLSAGTSRFLTFELGKGNAEKLKKTFNASLVMHTAMAALLLVLMETVGLWFINNKMNIPQGRELAANVVYQMSILTCMFTLTQVPYSATIISHEKMNIYAYVGLAQAFFQLALVSFLLYIPFKDNLIAYAIMLALWGIGLQIFYRLYCYRRFQETHLKFCREKSIYRSMLSYSMWDTIGAFCSTGNSQGVNILINMFFGVTINAARAIAYQVESAINQLANNFTVSVNPQIVKSYARGDFKRFFQLIYEAGRYSYFLMFMAACPLWLEADYVLRLWLVNVPEFTVLFLRFIIVIAVFRIFSQSIIKGVHATGNVKVLNLTSGVYSVISFIPLVYLAFKLGFPVWSCFVILSFNAVICTTFEIRALYKQVNFNVWDYIYRVYIRSIFVTSLSAIFPILVVLLMEESFLRLLTTTLVSTISLCVCIYFWGIDRILRKRVNSLIKKKILKW